MKKINLFCLPFAGGNKHSYRQYKLRSPSFLNIIPLEYPGRGARINEALPTDTQEIVDDLYEQIKGNLEEGYALYGHSMGGLIAYLLTKKIIECGHRPPLHLFVTGAAGPSSARGRGKQLHLLDKTEFLEEVGKLRGLPDELLADHALMDFFEPMLRADFKVSETYSYEESDPMDVPITVITGSEEEMKKEEINVWQKESSRRVDFRVMEGHHFFIYSHVVEIVDLIVRKLITIQKYYHYE
jgi:surfactin synthase thioesterase subunit